MITDKQRCNRLKLVQVISAVDEKKFNMREWDCGTTACAFGHYCRARGTNAYHYFARIAYCWENLIEEFGFPSAVNRRLFGRPSKTKAQWFADFKAVLEQEERENNTAATL